MHNPPVTRLPPLKPAVWRRGAQLADSIGFTRLVIQLGASSASTPIANTRVVLTALTQGTDASRTGNGTAAAGAKFALVPDSSGIARATIRAGWYAVRSVGIGYVDRYDTIAARRGGADTLLLDMRGALFCLY